MKTKEKSVKQTSLFSYWLSEYSLLVKLRLSLTIVFSSVLAYAITAASFRFIDFLVLSVGGYAVTASANILNEIFEKDYDRLMQRTSNRPLAAGRLGISSAVMIAGVHALIGLFALAYFNPTTVLLGVLAIFLYAFMYTPLKRISTIAITVGAISGALPVLIGTVAATGVIGAVGLILFGIQFLWQYPHFWSIGWLGHAEYRKAGYKLCPTNFNGDPDEMIGVHSAIYSLLLIPMSALLYLQDFSSLVSIVFIAVLSVIFAYYGIVLYRKNDRPSALKLMFASLIYLPLVLIILFIDKLM